ncbi:hypothetical protein SO694_00010524 [Aureococcus anophagefferens]|uniref:Uncharacterized protein n=1 Tax=Aureococcus anophagefferens TaxID=44056 RepID=A0ABR1GFT0_AURAN
MRATTSPGATARTRRHTAYSRAIGTGDSTLMTTRRDAEGVEIVALPVNPSAPDGSDVNCGLEMVNNAYNTKLDAPLSVGASNACGDLDCDARRARPKGACAGDSGPAADGAGRVYAQHVVLAVLNADPSSAYACFRFDDGAAQIFSRPVATARRSISSRTRRPPSPSPPSPSTAPATRATADLF